MARLLGGVKLVAHRCQLASDASQHGVVLGGGVASRPLQRLVLLSRLQQLALTHQLHVLHLLGEQQEDQRVTTAGPHSPASHTPPPGGVTRGSEGHYSWPSLTSFTYSTSWGSNKRIRGSLQLALTHQLHVLHLLGEQQEDQRVTTAGPHSPASRTPPPGGATRGSEGHYSWPSLTSFTYSTSWGSNKRIRGSLQLALTHQLHVLHLLGEQQEDQRVTTAGPHSPASRTPPPGGATRGSEGHYSWPSLTSFTYSTSWGSNKRIRGSLQLALTHQLHVLHLLGEQQEDQRVTTAGPHSPASRTPPPGGATRGSEGHYSWPSLTSFTYSTSWGSNKRIRGSLQLALTHQLHVLHLLGEQQEDQRVTTAGPHSPASRTPPPGGATRGSEGHYSWPSLTSFTYSTSWGSNKRIRGSLQLALTHQLHILHLLGEQQEDQRVTTAGPHSPASHTPPPGEATRGSAALLRGRGPL